MKDFRNLSINERRESRKGMTIFEANEKARNCQKSVLELLKNNSRATYISWKIAWGSYLINTPEQIAEYCIKQSQN